MTPADNFDRAIRLLEETRETLRKSVELRRQCVATREASQKQTERMAKQAASTVVALPR